MTASRHREARPNSLEDGSNSSSAHWGWPAIAQRTIYFGHQSVGSGVVAGVEGLAREYSLPIRVVKAAEPATVTGPAFVHFLVGQKRDYASKNAAMLRL